LSISQVSAQILSGRLLGEQAVSLDPQLKVQRFGPEGLVGSHPAELAIRQRTRGASVVAVERREDLILELGSDFRFQPEDLVYVCGSEEAIERYRGEFG